MFRQSLLFLIITICCCGSKLYSKIEVNNLNVLEQYLLLTKVKNYNTGKMLLAYGISRQNLYYLSLKQLVAVLEFDISVKDSIIKIVFFHNEHTEVDINQPAVTVNNKSIKINRSDILISKGSLYFNTKLLEKMLNIKLKIDPSRLILVADSTQSFPLELKMQRINNRNDNLYDYNEKKQKTANDYNIYQNLWSYPTLDLLLTNNYNHNNSSSNIGSYDLSLGGVILGLDADLYQSKDYNWQQDKRYSDINTNILFSKTLMPEYSRSHIRYFALGDVNDTGNALVSNLNFGRGITISSLDNHNINSNNKTNLTGALKPGWDVELYHNNKLIGYQNKPKEGSYNFKEIPVYYGLNTFKLIFYGPFGKTRTKITKILIGNAPTIKGQFKYRVSVMQNRQKVVEHHNIKENMGPLFTYSNKVGGNLDLYYGILDELSLNLGYAYYPNFHPDSHPKNSVKKFEKTKKLTSTGFYNIGAIYSFYGLAFANYIASSATESKYANMTRISGNFKYIGNILLSYQKFNGLKSPAAYSEDSLLMKSYLEVNYSPNLGYLNYVLPLHIGYDKSIYMYDSLKYNENTSFNLDYNIYHQSNLDLEYSYNKTSINKQNLFKTSLFNIYHKLRTNVYYQLAFNEGDALKQNAGLTMHYDFSKTFSTHLQVDYSGINIKNASYQAGLYKKEKFGTLSFDVATDAKKYYSLILGYNISLGYDPQNNQILYQGTSPFNNTGNISADIFVDNNSNGIYDKGIDKHIKGAQLLVNSSSNHNHSDKEGEVLIYKLATYSPITLSLNLKSISDIMLTPIKGKYNVILRPSIIQKLNFPLIKTGNIEGKLTFQNKECKFTKVKISSSDKNINNVVITDEQGLFLFENIPYKTYVVTAKCVSSEYKVASKVTVNKYTQYVDLN